MLIYFEVSVTLSGLSVTFQWYWVSKLSYVALLNMWSDHTTGIGKGGQEQHLKIL